MGTRSTGRHICVVLLQDAKSSAVATAFVLFPQLLALAKLNSGAGVGAATAFVTDSGGARAAAVVVETTPPPWEPRAAQEIRTARPAATAPELDPPRGRAPPMPGAAWEMAAAARRARALAAGHVADSRAGTSPAGAARAHLCRALAATGTSAGGRISTGRGGRRKRESGGR